MSSHKHDVALITGAHVHDSGEISIRGLLAVGIPSKRAFGTASFIAPKIASHLHGLTHVAGAFVHGVGGHGIAGRLIPSNGANGPSYLYNDLVFPEDQNKEIRGLIETPPVGTTEFFVWEDGSFTLGGPPGTYTFNYRLYADGIDQGTATITVTVPLTVSLAPAGFARSIAFGNPSVSGIVLSLRQVNMEGIGSGIIFGDPTVNRIVIGNFRKVIRLDSRIDTVKGWNGLRNLLG